MQPHPSHYLNFNSAYSLCIARLQAVSFVCELHACWCRLEDLPATVEAADSMLEHLVQLETATSPVGCFQILAMKQDILQYLQQPVDVPLSNEECINFVRKALS